MGIPGIPNRFHPGTRFFAFSGTKEVCAASCRDQCPRQPPTNEGSGSENKSLTAPPTPRAQSCGGWGALRAPHRVPGEASPMAHHSGCPLKHPSFGSYPFSVSLLLPVVIFQIKYQHPNPVSSSALEELKQYDAYAFILFIFVLQAPGAEWMFVE